MLVVFSPEIYYQVELNEVAALEYPRNNQCLLQCIGKEEGIKGQIPRWGVRYEFAVSCSVSLQ